MSDPYRDSESRPTRFAVTIDGERLEADTFYEIIAALRDLGHGADDMIEVAMAVTKCPRGAVVTTSLGSAERRERARRRAERLNQPIGENP